MHPTLIQGPPLDKFAAIHSFVVVAQHRSFALAARQMGVTASVVTKRVSGLEHELQVTLLARNTRKLALTPEGELFFERCSAILASLESAEMDLAQSNLQPLGRLHVQLPMVVGRLHVVPRLQEFFRDYPHIDLRITQSDKPQDLIANGIDVALWSGDLPDSRLVAKRLTLTQRLTCATAAYLDQHGRPQTPQDLPAHNCLRSTVFLGGRCWLFRLAEGEVAVPVKGNLLMDNSDNYREAVLGGLGLGQGTTVLFGHDLQAGRLELVLADYVANGQTLWAVYPQAMGRNLKVKAFVKFLEQVLPDGMATRPG